MRSVRQKSRAKARAYPNFVDLHAALRARTFAAWDRAVTAPLHGFADEVDYWRRASSGPYLGHIRRPTLLINALDDPFVPASSLPDPRELPPTVRAEYVAAGGHVGFVEGWPWRATSWAERRAVDFLAATVEGLC
jgi:predicted alpha/beta-fold hydrolase